MHIYIFGSVCRGDITIDSDVDLLAATEGHDERLNATTYSIYSYDRLKEIWLEGNPFAWHLHLEAKLVYSDDGSDFLLSLGSPAQYSEKEKDCLRFMKLFASSKKALAQETNSQVFELSTIFLAVRNFATCYSLGELDTPDFSRRSALRLGDKSAPIDEADFSIFERARILCTRGEGGNISPEEVAAALKAIPAIDHWMSQLLEIRLDA
jgi:acyl-CoA synthetase (AMP-forming)/AMP-acid ligase II